MRTLICGLIFAPALAHAQTATLVYPFDGDGSDAQGTGADLSLSAGASTTSSNKLSDFLGGSWDSGDSLSLATAGDHASHGDDALFAPSAFTFSSWVRIPDFSQCTGGHCSIVSKGNTDGSPNGYWLITNGSGMLRLSISGNGPEASFYGDTLTAGQWHHVVATWDGSTGSLYLDGNLGGSQAISHAIGYGSETFYVGTMTNRSYDLVGQVDELRLYHQALSAAEVATLYGWYVDGDGDGFTGDDDCDPADGTVYPGAPESCDAVDSDCDGATDDPDAIDAATWYPDADGDGYGDGASGVSACAQVSGHLADATDCDDAEGAVNPGATESCNGVDDNCDGSVDESGATGESPWYADADGDGFGDANSSALACAQVSGHLADATDCDDADTGVNPAATESCNSVDDDCDGSVDESGATGESTWYADMDGDGYGNAALSALACNPPVGHVADATDCDDAASTTYPGATETWYDGVDADCDGASDFDADADTFESDAHGGNDCDDAEAATYPGATDSWYDGVDSDCDGASDFDSDGDTHDSETYGGDDCDDADPDTYPGAPDTPYDGAILDCDHVSDYDADGDGHESHIYGGDDCDDANSAIHPEVEETWYDGVDDDCDGNDDDQDGDRFGVDDDCDDTDADVYPGAPGWGDDCEPEDTSDAEDTAVPSDTDDAHDTGVSGEGVGTKGWGCTHRPARPHPAGALLALGLLLARRREQR